MHFCLFGHAFANSWLQFGISGCGVQIACKLAHYGLGDSLFNAARALSRSQLRDFLCDWRHDLRHELQHDTKGYLGRTYRCLARKIHDDFPSVDVVYLYVHPLTSWSGGGVPANLPNIVPQNINIASLVSANVYSLGGLSKEYNQNLCLAGRLYPQAVRREYLQ